MLNYSCHMKLICQEAIMTKLLGFLALLASFIWTWMLFNSRDAININIHAGVQNQLVQLIEASIKKHNPQSSKFEVINISTEKLDDQKLSAQFSLQYQDQLTESETTQQIMHGQAILVRGLSENPDIQKWIVQSIKSSSSQIEFKEGLVISSDGKAQEGEALSPVQTPENESKASEKATD